MSVNDYLFRPIPGPYYLSKRIHGAGGDYTFRLHPENEARAVEAVRERRRVEAANRQLSS